MDHLSPVAQALSNPVILQEIFQYKSLSGKDLRLISKLWNEVILSLPRPKLCLKLNPCIKQACCDPSKFLDQIYPTISTPKLARWIKISKGCQTTHLDADSNHSREASDISAAKLISTMCQKYSETIQEIKVHSRLTILPTLYKILAKSCPKLKRLSVTCPRRRGGIDPTVATFDSPLPKKFKLEYIRFILDDPPHTFMQQIVNAAPNLKTLFIVGNLYPDLAKTPNISRLFHYGRGKTGPGGSSQAFNGDSLTRLISQIANSLIYLKIGLNTDEGKYSPDTAPDTFSLPENMPKLKVLHNRCVDIFKCPDEMGGLIGAAKKFKNLEHILFGCSAAAGKELLDKFLEVLFSSKEVLSRAVRKIVVQDLTESLGPLAKLRNVYPTVTEVELYFLHKVNAPEEMNPAVFSSQLELLLQIGGLKKITLNMTMDLSLSDFVKALSDNKELFKGKGLKQLMLLRESPTSDISDDLYESGKIEKYGIKNFIKEFESVLFATKGLELVVISGVIFRGPTAHRIINFIRDENLPVQFY
ncbi:uncharacterized protein LOC110858871 [Folsomia candida]|uniref:F-box domain-containing protein n=1 Tax=Folsomia candida TaxID=158441 RepID=A0A226F4Z7_FOLCA|nr:uncharacterized protein LOC110858871 [Folsomia candida]XP_021963455.1 uncharacterized protein LOC110858871 [Folsomia candida]OXA64484.1 hypothetical protein Fcan01_00092 [Folsomia candida]